MLNYFENENVGLCVTDKNAFVLYQNKSCEKICGQHMGKICEVNNFQPCSMRQLYRLSESGSYRFTQQKIKQQTLDILVSYNQQRVIKLLHPMTKSDVVGKIIPMEEENLTPKELEIYQMLLSRTKKIDIAQQLNISENTVKWHVRRIYKKLPYNKRLILKKIRERT